jgi:glycosyltransferase involved in cell wall biosynthesis
MRYTVLTLTSLNRLGSLQRCLEKVQAGAHFDDYEIVVVNNGSQDGTTEYLATLSSDRLRAVHRQDNEGVCARNYGIEIARGQVIIQIDDDVLVSPGFDRILLEPYGRPEVGATGQHGFYQDSTWGLLIDDRRRPKVGQHADLLMGFCWSWRNERDAEPRQYFTEARPGEAQVVIGRWPRFRYDWDFSPFWHEESDLQCQIRAAGYRLMVTRPVASHQTRHDWRETMADGPVTGTSIAADNFFKLKDKWQHSDLPFEGPLVGLHGPAPGGPARRRA